MINTVFANKVKQSQVMRKYLIFLLIIAYSLSANPAFSDEVKIGVTFSPVQCGYLDQSWKSTYSDILDLDLGIIRLGAYWNEIEPKEGIYDFTRLDFQIEEAKKRGLPIVLTVGMKAPRWPEYFIPEWALKKIKLSYACDVSKSEYLRKNTLRFVRKVVERYTDEKAITCWQVENEPLDRAGPGLWYISSAFLRDEAMLIRMIDKAQRPLMINIATYPNRFLRYINKLFSLNNPLKDATGICDILGLNIYPTIGQKFFGIEMIFKTSTRQREKYIKRIKEYADKKDIPVWITELQAEPWDPGKLVHLDYAQPETCGHTQMESHFSEMRSLGIDTIFLWGAEYWFFRKKNFQDSSWIDTARRLIKS